MDKEEKHGKKKRALSPVLDKEIGKKKNARTYKRERSASPPFIIAKRKEKTIVEGEPVRRNSLRENVWSKKKEEREKKEGKKRLIPRENLSILRTSVREAVKILRGGREVCKQKENTDRENGRITHFERQRKRGKKGGEERSKKYIGKNAAPERCGTDRKLEEHQRRKKTKQLRKKSRKV